MTNKVEQIQAVQCDTSASENALKRNWAAIFVTTCVGFFVGFAPASSKFPRSDLSIREAICGPFAMIVGTGLLFMIIAFAITQILLWCKPKAEKEWHRQSFALAKKIALFNERLSSLKALANFVEEADKGFGDTVAEDYEAERERLEYEKRAHFRKEAIRRFSAAIAKETDGKFKDTRDVASHLLVARIRLADETVAVATVEEDERFTALEEPEQPAKRFTSSTHS